MKDLYKEGSYTALRQDQRGMWIPKYLPGRGRVDVSDEALSSGFAFPLKTFLKEAALLTGSSVRFEDIFTPTGLKKLRAVEKGKFTRDMVLLMAYLRLSGYSASQIFERLCILDERFLELSDRNADVYVWRFIRKHTTSVSHDNRVMKLRFDQVDPQDKSSQLKLTAILAHAKIPLTPAQVFNFNSVTSKEGKRYIRSAVSLNHPTNAIHLLYLRVVQGISSETVLAERMTAFRRVPTSTDQIGTFFYAEISRVAHEAFSFPTAESKAQVQSARIDKICSALMKDERLSNSQLAESLGLNTADIRLILLNVAWQCGMSAECTGVVEAMKHVLMKYLPIGCEKERALKVQSILQNRRKRMYAPKASKG